MLTCKQSPFPLQPSRIQESAESISACKDVTLAIFGGLQDAGLMDAFWELYDISWALLAISSQLSQQDPGFPYIRNLIVELWEDVRILQFTQPKAASLHEFFRGVVFYLSGSGFSVGSPAFACIYALGFS